MEKTLIARSVLDRAAKAAVGGTRDAYGDRLVEDDYSGRGMWGETCVSFRHDYGPELYDFISVVAEAVGPEFVAVTRTDALGLSTIAYWPGFGIEENA